MSNKYHNKDFDSFNDVLRHFLYNDALVSQTPLTACFAVAGPVKGNTVRFTNRDSWSIDGDIISEEFSIPVVKLVNDFLAVGYGILTLNEEKECISLQKGIKDNNAPIACIGAGTGLGECFLTPANGVYQCFPCEGGHTDFAPRNEVCNDNFLVGFVC
jgi:glucokinase